MSGHAGERRLLVSLALISAAALALQLVVMRLLSIVQWHHFAYMVISLALLGFGLAGTLTALWRGPLLRHFDRLYPLLAAAFGLFAIAGFALAQEVPFNALAVLWEPRQWLRLALLFLLQLPAFLCAALCICLALSRNPEQSPRLYAANLAGSGAGCLLALLLLQLMPAQNALGVAAAFGPLAAAVVLRGHRARLAALAVALLLGLAGPALEPEPVEYKALPQALRVMGARHLLSADSALARLDVVENLQVPFRHAPGLALTSRAPIPEQLALFHDADAMSTIIRGGTRADLRYLAEMSSAAPYAVNPQPGRVLVLGAGAGQDVLQALQHGAATVDAVELDSRLIGLLNGPLADYSGRLYQDPRVHLHLAEARRFVLDTTYRYDVIQIGLLDAFNTSAAGLYALNESHLYTVEALRDYLARLEADGVLAITRWLRVPPRDDLRLFATAVRVLRDAGEQRPGRRLIWLRGWNTSTLLIGASPFSRERLEAVRRFAEEHSFDLIHPDPAPGAAGDFNRLSRPWFRDGARALLSPQDRAEAFIAGYPLDIRPTTDDRPYFFQFLRWDHLPRLDRLRGSGTLSLLDMAYLALVATLILALVLALPLVLLPFAASGVRGKGGVIGYYLAIGLGFMFVEMASIQRLVLYLGHPLYAAAVVIAAFLLFAGAGSLHLARMGRLTAMRLLPLLPWLALYPLLLGLMVQGTLHQPLPLRAALAMLLIAPLAWTMGRPFALGLVLLGERQVQAVPWAWAVNGFASVVAAPLATLLAIHFGISRLLWLALLLYAIAAVLLGRSTAFGSTSMQRVSG